MYSKRTGLIIGFHGCDISVRDKVVCEKGEILKSSDNEYDWLGGGVYFWENNYDRAYEFAKFLKENPPHNKKQKITTPAVIGAIIDLGLCLDLLDSRNLKLLKESYKILKQLKEKQNLEIPKNVSLVKNGDLLKRNLDCAVIELIHQHRKAMKLQLDIPVKMCHSFRSNCATFYDLNSMAKLNIIFFDFLTLFFFDFYL